MKLSLLSNVGRALRASVDNPLERLMLSLLVLVLLNIVGTIGYMLLEVGH